MRILNMSTDRTSNRRYDPNAAMHRVVTPMHELELINPKVLGPKFHTIWFPVLEKDKVDD